jgi:hypothetical protein
MSLKSNTSFLRLFLSIEACTSAATPCTAGKEAAAEGGHPAHAACPMQSLMSLHMLGECLTQNTVRAGMSYWQGPTTFWLHRRSIVLSFPGVGARASAGASRGAGKEAAAEGGHSAHVAP